MSDAERIVKLKKLASELNIRLHLISVGHSSDSIAPTKVDDFMGIVVIDTLVNNELAFYLQQHRYDSDE